MKQLETSRLILKPFSKANITDEYISWLNNVELMRYSEQRHRVHNFESCLAYLNTFHGNDNLFLAIYLKDSLIHVGNTNAYIDQKRQIADVGILIGAEAAKNRGIGLEAWVGILAFLFWNTSIQKVTAGTMAVNAAMLRIFEKSHMTASGILPKQYSFNGKKVDGLIYEITKNEFLAKFQKEHFKFD